MNSAAHLTRRETEVAGYLAWGAAKKEVADRLNISVRTVENISRAIYIKLGIQKATEVSVWWFCTKYGISFDLSPLRRGVISAFLLAILLPFEISKAADMIRPNLARRTAARSVRAGRRGKNETDTETTYNFYDYEELTA